MTETNEAADAAQGLIDALEKVGNIGLPASEAFTAKLKKSPINDALVEGVAQVFGTIADIEDGDFEFADADENATDEY